LTLSFNSRSINAHIRSLDPLDPTSIYLFVTYDETLDYLYSQLPMYQRVGNQAFKKGLGNIKSLLKSLGNPEKSYPSIHVAGTNGKGSVSHMLAAICQAKGLKVGLYTSPHYKDFRERIKVNGVMVGKRGVVRFVQSLGSIIDTVKPSFFEITVAMAFDAFRNAEVDIAIIETGLGGRLDSTNVITPLLSVITNISFDHMEMLGNTISEIAGEKAGIIKRNIPVVVGEWQNESAAVFKKIAKQRTAPISYASRNVRCEVLSSTWDRSVYDISLRRNQLFTKLALPNSGPFQAKNLSTAIWAMHVLQIRHPQFQITEKQLRYGLSNLVKLTGYRGRWQVLGKKPLILTDSAHNEAGLSAVFKRLSEYARGKVHVVLGLVREKDIDKVLSHFPKDAHYYFCRPDVPRGLDAGQLAGRAHDLGFHGRAYSSVRRALATARKIANKTDLIFVGGSSFVVAEVL
jgi:dihydrofolate synthase / folylpolyglutamate synthase